MIIKRTDTFLQLIVVALFMLGCNTTTQQDAQHVKATDNPSSAAPASAATIPDKNLLTGDWLRSDAGYQIQLSSLGDGGKMIAAYFNPNEIHVEKAGWSADNGFLKVYVELNDKNYPGSNYDLIYMAEKDLLIGKYFQAVEGVTYDVLFQRKK